MSREALERLVVSSSARHVSTRLRDGFWAFACADLGAAGVLRSLKSMLSAATGRLLFLEAEYPSLKAGVSWQRHLNYEINISAATGSFDFRKLYKAPRSLLLRRGQLGRPAHVA